jgi:hypothetical protein
MAGCMNKNAEWKKPKHRKRVNTRRLLLGLLIMGVLSVPLLACSVPVFRYALERWQSDTYHVLIFHREALTEEQQALVDQIRSYTETEYSRPSLAVEVLDVNEDMPEPIKPIWEANQDKDLPLVVLISPLYYGNSEPLWTAALDEKAVSVLLDSQVRRELVTRLTGGDTAVWLFMPSGDEQKDQEARKVLEDALKELETELKLPHELDESDTEYDMPLSGDVELKIQFSVLDLDYEDPTEALIMSIVRSGLGEDIKDSLPAAIPVYGRGRALMILDGEQLVPDNIAELCYFLVGPCSCQVKQQNPGVDLFIPVDWDPLITGMIDVNEALPMLMVPTALMPTEPNTAEPNVPEGYGYGVDANEVMPAVTAMPEAPESSKLNRNMIVLVILGMGVVLGLTLVLGKRKGS